MKDDGRVASLERGRGANATGKRRFLLPRRVVRRLAPVVDWGPRTTYLGDMGYTHLIMIEPGKRSGQPCIRGMRITVQDVLEYLAGGMTVEEVLADFPELTAEDLRLPGVRGRP